MIVPSTGTIRKYKFVITPKARETTLLFTHTCPVTEFAVASHLNTANSCCHHVFLRHFRFQKCPPGNSNSITPRQKKGKGGRAPPMHTFPFLFFFDIPIILFLHRVHPRLHILLQHLRRSLNSQPAAVDRKVIISGISPASAAVTVVVGFPPPVLRLYQTFRLVL